MNCKIAKKLHLTYWEQSPTKQKEIDSHLQACLECQESFHQVKNIVELCRKSLIVEEKLDDLEHYFDRLNKRLVKLSWSQRLKERILSTTGIINRSVWGPVPAYAVAAVALLAVIIVLPLSQSGKSLLSTQAAFRSNLVVEPFEPMRAIAKDGMTIYTLAQSTAPNPAPSTAASTDAR